MEKMRFNPSSIDLENLSRKERSFLDQYQKLLEENQIIIEQAENKNEYVGFICLEDIGRIQIDGEVIDMKFGEFYVANLEQIYFQLLQNKIKLA